MKLQFQPTNKADTHTHTHTHKRTTVTLRRMRRGLIRNVEESFCESKGFTMKHCIPTRTIFPGVGPQYYSPGNLVPKYSIHPITVRKLENPTQINVDRISGGIHATTHEARRVHWVGILGPVLWLPVIEGLQRRPRANLTYSSCSQYASPTPFF